MARRTFRGNTHSENGWPYVDQGSCTWVRIPGAEHVSLQIQNGPPLQILRAFAADYHAHVEPLRDHDSACWTEDNSVSTSNHPGGTGMDLNWNGPDGRTFRYGISEERAFPPPMNQRLRELLDFYEGTVYCGGFWSIRDWMHFQMGYGTYDTRADRPTQKTLDFIARKIRPDGFSTFNRGAAPQVDAADVLARATGLSYQRAAEILPTMRDGLIQADCTNPDRIAMFVAQTGHESANFDATEEYASGAAYEGRTDLGNTQPGDGVRFKGRSWIQITGRHNYTEFSRWAHGKGLVPTPTYFVDHPAELADLRWAGVGAAWYWTVARPDINALSDQRDLYTVTRRINGGTNGWEDRKRRYDRASALGDELLALIGEDDELSNPEIQRFIREIHGALFNRVPSQSIYATPGEGPRWQLHELIKNGDGMTHQWEVESQAKAGNLDELHRVVLVAKGLGQVTSAPAVQRAQRVLAEIEATNPEILQRYIAQRGAL
ncbi:putative lysin A [Mycobacterium phage PP]|uniref:Putative lysin A n=1 Tax=Mycobacterium phage PP TaxID=2077134 RepID=A0A2Z5XVD5_9CAUD|nr:endolysin [Mycobacterium phage PP]BBC53812.1 putative lysin A [Mycobacterium phage PP]